MAQVRWSDQQPVGAPGATSTSSAGDRSARARRRPRPAAARPLRTSIRRPVRCAIRGCGTWRAGRAAGAAAPRRSRPVERVDLDLGPAVAGVAPGDEVEPAQELPVATTTVVAGPDEPPRAVDARRSTRIAARPAGSRSGGVPSTTMLHASRCRSPSRSSVERRARGRSGGAAARAPTARARSDVGSGRNRTRRAAERRDRGGEIGVVARDLEIGRPVGGLPHSSPGRIITAAGARRPCSTRRRRRAGTRRRPRARSPRSPGSGATSAIWRSRSITCFTLRTKSPPVISSSSSTSARSSPFAHAWIAAVKPGSGRRVSGSRASRSVTCRSRQMRSIARRRACATCSVRPAAAAACGSSPSGPRRWNTKHDTSAASVGGVDARRGGRRAAPRRPRGRTRC